MSLHLSLTWASLLAGLPAHDPSPAGAGRTEAASRDGQVSRKGESPRSLVTMLVQFQAGLVELAPIGGQGVSMARRGWRQGWRVEGCAILSDALTGQPA